MGCCLSKTNPSQPPPLSNFEPETTQPDAESKIPPTQSKEISKTPDVTETEKNEELQITEQEEKKESKDKEEFVIQPRKSHDKKPDPKGLLRSDSSEQPESNNQKSLASNIMAMAANGGVVRTSSCTKEEVDAILIQCGRLSRSSSSKCASSGSNRKYSGSKRSHDFDKENSTSAPIELNCDENEDDERQRRRQSRGGSNRSRTASSRSRERDPHAQKSGGGGGGGRRLSRSPAKRSETSNNTTTTTTTTSASNRPGKLVSVPATVSSLSMEKSNNGDGAGSNVKRVLVRRNVTPPRSRSPARSALVGGGGGSSNGVKNASNQNQPSPSRNLSRKAEHSPYRRTPLTDLDMNSLPFQPLGNKSSSVKGNQKIRELNGEVSAKQQPLTSVSQNKVGAVQGTHRRARSRGGEGNDLATEAASGSNTLTRTRSSRRSRDLDVESLSNPNPTTNYTSLLLQDIQNFHQKASSTTSTNTSAPPFKLPECVSKACSIVEAVADLNLNSCSTRPIGRVNGGDDDLMEPSLQKFVTVEKKREIDEKEESSGSNSVAVGGQNQWVSSSASSWEHGSEGVSPASFQRLATVSSSSRSGVARSRAGNGR